MAGQLPVGDPVPANAALPSSAAIGADERDFGVYIHIPFCTVRCGYCDFNTYTATELRGARQEDFWRVAAAEIDLAADRLADLDIVRPARTIFFGGGTPTLLPPSDLVALIDRVRTRFGLAPDAEVTVEANPDTVDHTVFRALADGGVTRASIGMQSAVPHVLATLDRTHTPERVPQAVAAARAAGLETSLDLIYGTPGESLDDWRASVEQVVALAPDHLSAYALIVEPGTALHRRIARGELPDIDDDAQADAYELVDDLVSAAGYEWYEVSNWARHGRVSRHNLAYWRGSDWWGIGPGAHSHVGGVRWWNVKHPSAYAGRLAAGTSPAHSREVLDPETRRVERVLLEVRIREGLPIAALRPQERVRVAGLIADALVDAQAALGGQLVLTRRGRLLADAVVRRLLD